MHGVQGLVTCLLELMQTFGVPEQIASDGGSEFMSHEAQQLLRDYGVHHRLSSVG